MDTTNYKWYRLDVVLQVVDWLTYNAAFWLCVLIGIWPLCPWGSQFVYCWAVGNVAYLVSQQLVGIVLHRRHARASMVMGNTFRTTVCFMVVQAAILGMSHDASPGFFRSAAVAFVVFATVLAERLALRMVVSRRRSRSAYKTPVVIVGTSEGTQRVVDVLCLPDSGYGLLGFFSDTEGARLQNCATGADVPLLGHRVDFAQYLETHRVGEVYVSMRSEQTWGLERLLTACDKHLVRVFFIPVLDFKGVRRLEMREFGDFYVMSQYREPLRKFRNRFLKRAFDVVVSGVFLCTLFPIILVVVAVVSKLTMPGPVFFRQKRTGYDGRDFYCLKFRSMKENSDSDKVQATKGDPRITRWGAFMRHTNIDELPQFLNVFVGDMSLVGPRPHMLAHTEFYSQRISEYMIRHLVRPGITGWAQTHGERGETRTVHDMERRVEKDIWYIENWSFWLDVQILFKTVADAVRGDEKAF